MGMEGSIVFSELNPPLSTYHISHRSNLQVAPFVVMIANIGHGFCDLSFTSVEIIAHFLKSE